MYRFYEQKSCRVSVSENVLQKLRVKGVRFKNSTDCSDFLGIELLYTTEAKSQKEFVFFLKPYAKVEIDAYIRKQKTKESLLKLATVLEKILPHIYLDKEKATCSFSLLLARDLKTVIFDVEKYPLVSGILSSSIPKFSWL